MEVHFLTIKAEKICQFNSKNEWVNKAQSRLSGFPIEEKIVCVDRNHNCLTIGLDFRIAEEYGCYPVIAYRLIRTSEEFERQ